MTHPPSRAGTPTADEIERRRSELKTCRGFEAQPETKELVRHASRATSIVGGVFTSISATGPLKSVGTWLAVLGRRIAGVVEAAIPDSAPRWFVRNLLNVVYLFGLLVVLVGTLFDFARPYRAPAMKLLGIALGFDLLLLVVGALIRSWHGWAHAIAIAVLGILALGVVLIVFLGIRALPGSVRDAIDTFRGGERPVTVLTTEGQSLVGLIRPSSNPAVLTLCAMGPGDPRGRMVGIPWTRVSLIDHGSAPAKIRQPQGCQASLP
jgi:hypothetical protein